jgi:hypothetical protein
MPFGTIFPSRPPSQKPQPPQQPQKVSPQQPQKTSPQQQKSPAQPLKVPQQQSTRQYDVWWRAGGMPVTIDKVRQYIDRVPLRPDQREYVKRTLERFNYPTSKGITREEFFKSLDEMAKNQKDPITPQQIERIKRAFL